MSLIVGFLNPSQNLAEPVVVFQHIGLLMGEKITLEAPGDDYHFGGFTSKCLIGQ
jgi:hypothetical protein